MYHWVLCSDKVMHNENFWGVELTFASSLTGILSHLGSSICKDSRPQSHSDTILHDSCDGEKFQGEKRVYKRVIHLFFYIKMEKNIFNSFFTKILVSKFFSKVSNIYFGEKTIKYIIFHQDEKYYS